MKTVARPYAISNADSDDLLGKIFYRRIYTQTAYYYNVALRVRLTDPLF